MKIFLDTNIFLDLLLKREKYENAVTILNSVKLGYIEAYILDITVVNIHYIAKKQAKNIIDFLNQINRVCIIKGADNKIVEKALKIANIDFEDNLQYILAKEFRCETIVTNDKNFYKKDIEVLNSTEFIDKYLKEENGF